jgi:hypothetical protein
LRNKDADRILDDLYKNLSLALLLDKALPPLDIVSLFFSTPVLSSIASYTNAYAELKDAGTKGLVRGRRQRQESSASPSVSSSILEHLSQEAPLMIFGQHHHNFLNTTSPSS